MRPHFGTALGRAALAAAALALMVGCGTRGALGNGSFEYDCVDGTDLACAAWTNGDMPPLIARSGRARVVFHGTASHGAAGDLPVGAVSAGYVAGVGDALVFLRPGFAGLVAVDHGITVDFIDVEVAAVSSVALGSGPLTMSPGGVTTVSAVPRDAHGEELAGALDYDFASSDETVVTVAQSGRFVEITAAGPGSTTVTAHAGDGSGAIGVTVEPLP